MEEKERYKLESYNEAFCQIHDTESGEWYLRKDLVTDLLNQQDKRIKELEEQTYPAYKREHERWAYLENIEVPRLEKENEQLKQQLHDLLNQIAEEIKDQIIKNVDITPDSYDNYNFRLTTRNECIECLDTILKKYGVEENGKSNM